MTLSPVAVAMIGCALAGCAFLLFISPSGGKRQLRERVKATREIVNSQSSAADSLADNSSNPGLFLKLASWLGYQADLPAAYRASPSVVGPLSAIVGVVTFNFSAKLLPQFAALLLGIALSLLFARILFHRKTKIYKVILFRQLPDAMSLLLRAVRAGLPVAEAIRNVGRESMAPTQLEFARVAGETALGMPVEQALRRLSERTNIQEYAFFSVIIGLHAQTGGNLSETLETMADMVRRRVAMAAKGKALSAESRLSAGVIAALPFVVGIITSVFNPEYLGEFLVNPKGPMLIGVFVVLLCSGLFVSHLMIQKSMED